VCGRKIERIGQIQELCQQAIEVDQQVLEPLLQLRGVGSVTVIGRVSNEWAQFLKQTMETEAGKGVGTFEHVNPVVTKKRTRQTKKTFGGKQKKARK